jgi:hypothetical protein
LYALILFNKAVINEKKRAFCEGDMQKVKMPQRLISNKIKQCKQQYKDKIEQQFADDDIRNAWSGLKSMLGKTKKSQHIHTDNNSVFASELNTFYSRFDCYDFSHERQLALDSLTDAQMPVITINDVRKAFSSIKIKKACGPDGLLGIVLKECREQLSPTFCHLYELSLNSHVIPLIWKTSNIIPVPKKANPVALNDYRPVALTSIAMKCFERVIKILLLQDTSHQLDSLQFAYRPKRGVEDATITLLHNTYEHLDKPGTHVRMLFVDFSSAFNTLQPYLLLIMLNNMGVNSNIIRWIDSFMSHRPQYVTVNGMQSPITHTHTGAPQGCVISPILFILYTNQLRCSDPDCLMIKFADDTVLAGFITNSDLGYRKAIADLVGWCDSHHLYLNTSKTKEVVIDFRRKKPQILPVQIRSEDIEQVDQYKYLGTYIDAKLSWKVNTDHICKKGRQRIHLLRQLKQFGVDKTIMQMFYKSFIQSILCFNFICWYGSLTVQCKNQLIRIVTTAEKVMGLSVEKLHLLHKKQTMKKASKIRLDSEHVLNCKYKTLPSGRRLQTLKVNTNRFRMSFIPSSIRFINDSSSYGICLLANI